MPDASRPAPNSSPESTPGPTPAPTTEPKDPLHRRRFQWDPDTVRDVRHDPPGRGERVLAGVLAAVAAVVAGVALVLAGSTGPGRWWVVAGVALLVGGGTVVGLWPTLRGRRGGEPDAMAMAAVVMQLDVLLVAATWAGGRDGAWAWAVPAVLLAGVGVTVYTTLAWVQRRRAAAGQGPGRQVARGNGGYL